VISLRRREVEDEEVREEELMRTSVGGERAAELTWAVELPTISAERLLGGLLSLLS